jgi:hypothetical protein
MDRTFLKTASYPSDLLLILLKLLADLVDSSERPRPEADFYSEAERYAEDLGQERRHNSRNVWATMLANQRWQEDVKDIAACVNFVSHQLSEDMIGEALAICDRIAIASCRSEAMLHLLAKAEGPLRIELISRILDTFRGSDRFRLKHVLNNLTCTIVPQDTPTILTSWHTALHTVSFSGHLEVIGYTRTILPLLLCIFGEKTGGLLDEVTAQVLNWWRPLGEQFTGTRRPAEGEIDNEVEKASELNEQEVGGGPVTAERALGTLIVGLCRHKELSYAKSLFGELLHLPSCSPKRLARVAVELSEACVEDGDLDSAYDVNRWALTILWNAIDKHETRMAWIVVAHCLMYQCVKAETAARAVSGLFEKILSLIRKYGDDEKFLSVCPGTI